VTSFASRAISCDACAPAGTMTAASRRAVSMARRIDGWIGITRGRVEPWREGFAANRSGLGGVYTFVHVGSQGTEGLG